MTYFEFGFSDEETQKKEVIEKGIILIEKELSDNKKMILYQVHNFYVEAEYCSEDDDIELVVAFANTDMLEDYLDDIDISKLLAK